MHYKSSCQSEPEGISTGYSCTLHGHAFPAFTAGLFGQQTPDECRIYVLVCFINLLHNLCKVEYEKVNLLWNWQCGKNLFSFHFHLKAIGGHMIAF